MLKKQIYLYQCLEEYRKNFQSEDPIKLCNYFDIKILKEKERDLFFGKEKAYFIVDENKKSCIVLEDTLDLEIQNEILVYSVFRILLLQNFTPERNSIQTFYKGTYIEYFYEEEDYLLKKANLNDLCLQLTLEFLIPIISLSPKFVNHMNYSRIKKLSEFHSVRKELVELRYKNIKKLFYNIQINTDSKNNRISKSYLEK